MEEIRRETHLGCKKDLQIMGWTTNLNWNLNWLAGCLPSTGVSANGKLVLRGSVVDNSERIPENEGSSYLWVPLESQTSGPQTTY